VRDTLTGTNGFAATGLAALAAPALVPLLCTQNDVAMLAAISKRTVKRLTAEDAIWGIVRIGRSVRYNLDQVRDWIRAGCPRTPRRK
jgi:hypothetical protein